MGVTNFAKSDLCQKQSKFRIQFCLGMLNNALYFSAGFCSIFDILCVQKTTRSFLAAPFEFFPVLFKYLTYARLVVVRHHKALVNP